MTAPLTQKNFSNLRNAAIEVLLTPDPMAKAQLTRSFAKAWRQGTSMALGTVPDHAQRQPPQQPPRPAKLALLTPDKMPRRRLGSQTGRVALLHAIAHIELNAIDLAWDMIARFGRAAMDEFNLGHTFLDDWVGVADDEARHCCILMERLVDFETSYGDLPAHDGLWQAARDTVHDFAARLAVVPMALEARGLDVTPTMAQKLKDVGDEKTAEILDVIYKEEIDHVRIGTYWFQTLCTRMDLDPQETFQKKVKKYFKGQLKPPFNVAARTKAGMPQAYYEG